MSLTLDRPQPARLDAAQPRREPRRVPQHSARWACVYTHPQAEIWADTNLRRAGYQTYLPTCAVRIRDRVLPTLTRIVIRPLFSRYLFVMFNHHTSSWSPIRATPGVADLLRNGAEIAYLNAGALRALRDGEALRATPAHPGAHWAPGAPVAVSGGVFSGHDAVITQVHGDQAQISLIMLGQMRQLTVPVACLVARE